MEETYNVLDKPSVEPHNKIRVVGDSSLHILKSIGREGVARGTMDQRRDTSLCWVCRKRGC